MPADCAKTFGVPASTGLFRLKAGLRTWFTPTFLLSFPTSAWERMRGEPHAPACEAELRGRGFPSGSLGTRIIRLVFTSLFLSAIFVGCTPSENDGTANSKPKDAHTEVEKGPVRVTVEVEPHPVRLSDEPKMTLTIDYQRGVKVDKPPFGEAVGDSLVILDFREPLPETKDDREIIRQIYTLEPTRTGQLQIDPVVVSFSDERSEGDGRPHTVETEALTIQVTSIIADEAPSLDDLEEIQGPVALPKPRSGALLWIVVACPCLLLAGLTIWLALRRKASQPERVLSPQELAYLELQQIIEAELSERDVKAFYVELTGVVRRYIERTTGIHAPEQTTEEFLREIGAGDVFSDVDRERLRSFLEAADLVKFAAHEPSAHDVEESFRRAKIFIGLESQEAAE